MKKAILILLFFSACSAAPFEYPSPLDFIVLEPVETFEACVSEGEVALLEHELGFTHEYSSPARCLGESAPPLEPESRYTLRSNVEPDRVLVWAFEPIPVAVD